MHYPEVRTLLKDRSALHNADRPVVLIDAIYEVRSARRCHQALALTLTVPHVIASLSMELGRFRVKSHGDERMSVAADSP
jgi:hypothetical protein